MTAADYPGRAAGAGKLFPHRGVELGELPQRLLDPGQPLLGRGSGGADLVHLGQGLFPVLEHDRGDQGVLVFEIIVDGAHRDGAVLRHSPQGKAAVPLGKQRSTGGQQDLTAGVSNDLGHTGTPFLNMFIKTV